MSADIPNDSDGDALRRLIATGSDLSKEMEIDFAVDVPDRESGLAFAEAARLLAFRTKIDQDDSTGRWTCYCSVTLVPTYDAILATQTALGDAGRKYGAKPDGWGSFGNAAR
jgi:hypothetical protein